VNRLLRWFLAHDPTTACAWEPAANDCCREWRKLADDLDAENDLLARRNHDLDQENTRLECELAEHRLLSGAAVVPMPGRLRVVEDLPVADESWLAEITKPGGWA
jgi:hypothetical protein